MLTDSQAGARAPRLNPFAFPADTDFRFVLLIVSVLGASVFMYSLLYLSFPANQERLYRTYARCEEEARAAYPTDFIARNNYVSQCIAPTNRVEATWIISGIVILLGVAGLIYWTFPQRKIRRDKLVPLSADDAPEVVAYLADLCREAGLSRMPFFVLAALKREISGLAFGRLGCYYVVLNGGLIKQFKNDRPVFRAVVLHELAHLRNADVDKTYFAVAIWQAFLVAALAPFAVSLFDNSLITIVDLGWRVLALTALVYLTRNAVLRAREFYADVRASVWDGPSGGLGRMLETLKPAKGKRWRMMLQVHPDPGERRRILDEPHRLFRMGFWDAFGTGIACTIAFSILAQLLFLLKSDSETKHLIWALTWMGGRELILVALVIAPLASSIVGIGIWRAKFAAMARGETARSVVRLGLGLALGFVCGEFLSLSSAVTRSYNVFAVEQIGSTFFYVLGNGLMLLSLFFFLWWIEAGASVWLEVAATGRSPRLAYRVGLIIAGGLLVVWFGLLFYIKAVRAVQPFLEAQLLNTVEIRTGPNLFAYLAPIQHPLHLLTLMSLWAFPLAAWFWRRRVASASGSSWAFLDVSSQQLALPRQAPFRLDLALKIGLIGGLAFCGLLLALRVGVRLGVAEITKNTDGFKVVFFTVQVVIAALVQAVVAVIVAGRVKRLPGLHGLFAAFVAGCTMAGGILGLNLLFGGTIDAKFAWWTFSWAVNGGALLSLLVILVVSALTWLSKATRRKLRPAV